MVNRNGLNSLIYFFCLLPIWVWSTEFCPWVGNYLEFEERQSLVYQTYSKLALDSGLISRSSNDFFLTTSLSNAIDPRFSIEIEATMAHTLRQSMDLDHIRLTGRYMWLDDIVGDRLALTTGISLIQSFVSSLHDMSSFHHGRGESELFISIGQENTQDISWKSRWWAMGGVGVANRGSAWLRSQFAYEYRFLPKHEWSFFANGLWGLGHKTLPIHHFHGYGPIQHQSFDLGIRYTYLIEFFGSFSLEYSQRVYARNFPAQTHRFLLRLLYTFGL